MSESDDAARFARELDRLLSGEPGAPDASAANPDLETARRLLALDLDPGGAARRAVRARLPLRRVSRAGLSARAALAAVLAAAALVAVRRAPTAVTSAARSSLPVLSGRFPAPRPGPFAPPFDSAVARAHAYPGGRAVEWSLPGLRVRLESRAVTSAELFVKPQLMRGLP